MALRMMDINDLVMAPGYRLSETKLYRYAAWLSCGFVPPPVRVKMQIMSVERNGVVKPELVGYVTDGRHRVAAANLIKLTQMPVIDHDEAMIGAHPCSTIMLGYSPQPLPVEKEQ